MSSAVTSMGAAIAIINCVSLAVKNNKTDSSQLVTDDSEAVFC